MSLFIISILTFSYSSGNLVMDEVYEGFSYSDHIVPGEELVWNVARFDYKGDNELVWEIKTGYEVKEGDQIKIKVTKDPDELNIGNYAEPFYTDENWADFYLNDIFLSDDPSELKMIINITDDLLFGWLFVLPTTLEFASGDENFFVWMYDEVSPHTYNNENGSLEVSLTSDLYTQKIEIEYDYVLIFLEDRVVGRRSVEMSYDIEWGTLDKLDLYSYLKFGSDVTEAQIVLLNENSTQRVSISWATGFVALLIIGLAVGYIRKR